MKFSDKNPKINSLIGLLIFCSISAFAWLMVKLSDNYTITLKFNTKFIDTPANQIIRNEEYPIEATVVAPGFNLLNYYLVPHKSREITVSLKDMKYKILSDNRYSVGGNLIKEAVADFLEINVNDVALPQTDYVFTMYKLASKRVKVNLLTDLTFKSQYNIYGEPTVSPDSITIFGAYNIIRDYEYVNTRTVVKRGVIDDIREFADIQLDDDIYSDVKKVEVDIDVEKFTESEVTLPINTLGVNNLVIFPDRAKIKYIVALKDYPNINDLAFNLEIDTTNFKKQDLLPVRVAIYPNNTSIIGIIPDKVEYLVTE